MFHADLANYGTAEPRGGKNKELNERACLPQLTGWPWIRLLTLLSVSSGSEIIVFVTFILQGCCKPQAPKESVLAVKSLMQKCGSGVVRTDSCRAGLGKSLALFPAVNNVLSCFALEIKPSHSSTSSECHPAMFFHQKLFSSTHPSLAPAPTSPRFLRR